MAKYYVMCNGKKKKAENKMKAIIIAKDMAARSMFNHRSGIYEDGKLIRTITLTDLC